MTHIIFEGPDGGGKTTLLEVVHNKLGLPLWPRASSSMGGPIKNLTGWVEDVDLYLFDDNHTSHLFDRHALVSEPVYSAALDRAMPEMFRQPWWMTRYRQGLYNHALIVFCLPSLTVVRQNMEKDTDQMPGVREHIADIYQRYHATWQNWGGPCVRYDYTTNDQASFTEMIGRWILR
jgi:hypothetical protein